MIFAAWSGFKRPGIGAKIQVAFNILALLVIAAVLIRFGASIAQFTAGVPKSLVAGVIIMLATHALFYQWLKAPTLAGRRLLDQVEGFIRVESGTQDGRSACMDQRNHENVRPADMKEWKLQCRFVSAVDTPGRGGVDTVPGDIAVGQNGAFGQPGRSG